MLTCIHCNTPNGDDDLFCIRCGRSLYDSKIQNIQTSDTNNSLEPQNNTQTQASYSANTNESSTQNNNVLSSNAQHSSTTSAMQQPNNPIKTMNPPIKQHPGVFRPTGQGRFINSDEFGIATLENGIVMNLISGEGFRKEDAVLSNRRLYYNHKDGIFSVSEYTEVVDITDITGTKIASYSPFGILVTSILLIILSIFMIMISPASNEELGAIILLCGVIALILFFSLTKKYLKIEYAGGDIRFSVKKYGMQNIKMFQRCIHSAKDAINTQK